MLRYVQAEPKKNKFTTWADAETPVYPWILLVSHERKPWNVKNKHEGF